ncbi:hypothetical protein HDU99_003927, partial [Rhizoclosmatium hyalinum]
MGIPPPHMIGRPPMMPGPPPPWMVRPPFPAAPGTPKSTESSEQGEDKQGELQSILSNGVASYVPGDGDDRRISVISESFSDGGSAASENTSGSVRPPPMMYGPPPPMMMNPYGYMVRPPGPPGPPGSASISPNGAPIPYMPAPPGQFIPPPPSSVGGNFAPPNLVRTDSDSSSIRSTGTNATGRQVTLPYGESLEVYRQNAKKSGDPAVQLDFAKFLIATGDTAMESDPDPKKAKKNQDILYAEGLKWVKKLCKAESGRTAYPEAMFFLAECYGNGSLGLSVDHDRAFSLYVQASKQNHPAAAYRAAVCYEVGAGTKKDYSRSVQFYRKSAALGDTAAMYKLGMILLNGLLSQPKNPREGITWLKRAGSQADETTPHALHELATLYEGKGETNGVIIPDPSYAHDLYRRGAQLGYSPSQYKLGVCYEYGLLDLPIDARRSIAWYTRSAEQGDPEAELALSGWYLTGAEGVLKQSDTEAYLWA